MSEINSQNYAVIITGSQEGGDLGEILLREELVRENIVTMNEAAELFRQLPAIIFKGISFNKAVTYRNTLKGLGALVDIIPDEIDNNTSFTKKSVFKHKTNLKLTDQPLPQPKFDKALPSPPKSTEKQKEIKPTLQPKGPKQETSSPNRDLQKTTNKTTETINASKTTPTKTGLSLGFNPHKKKNPKWKFISPKYLAIGLLTIVGISTIAGNIVNYVDKKDSGILDLAIPSLLEAQPYILQNSASHVKNLNHMLILKNSKLLKGTGKVGSIKTIAEIIATNNAIRKISIQAKQQPTPSLTNEEFAQGKKRAPWVDQILMDVQFQTDPLTLEQNISTAIFGKARVYIEHGEEKTRVITPISVSLKREPLSNSVIGEWQIAYRAENISTDEEPKQILKRTTDGGFSLILKGKFQAKPKIK